MEKLRLELYVLFSGVWRQNTVMDAFCLRICGTIIAEMADSNMYRSWRTEWLTESLQRLYTTTSNSRKPIPDGFDVTVYLCVSSERNPSSVQSSSQEFKGALVEI